MAVNTIDREHLDYFKERVSRLQPDSQRRFGSLDVLAMMRHMRNVFEAAMGEVEYPEKSIPVVSKAMFWLFCHVFTKWPKGKIKAPDFWTPPPDHEFEEEQRLLLESMDRFVEMLEKEPAKVTSNPFFGPLTLRQWSRLNGVHFNHHFRQFGVI